ncbi:Gfo/Idh/MocA family protein [Kitasatospora sp. CB02891]|uniref:Gfo/Idh/MocA family protein n=1 Tax=Kitasatospora sp. CB02891 TaxID=2020329 RepID=UPI001E3943A9|nr:Gfo/Idh/MocA family oxidoreductase [Kitasatospora sp. CB02891]
MPDRQVTLAVVGAGLRGGVYARSAHHGGRGRIVAVAEPDPERRAAFAAEYGVPDDAVFADWRELAARPRLADAAVVATQDNQHTEPVEALAQAGYHLLLEKPMATTEEDCLRIVRAAEKAGVLLAVCHVLRYTTYTRTIKEMIDSGRIGEVVSIQHLEPVGWWHQAHSFVRGNWRREDESSPMLLAKSSHDVDWLLYLMGRPPERVSSFGGLVHFNERNRPAAAADNCLDCPVEPSCPYSAPRLYLGCLGDPDKEYWPLGAVTTDRTPEGIRRALRTGPYGRCVYACDNDVVDTQVVDFDFGDGRTASFTMSAFTPLDFRKTRIFGTRGYVEGDGVRLSVHDFTTATWEFIDATDVPGADASAAAGHGGADDRLFEAFVEAVATGAGDRIRSSGRDSLAAHRTVWAAEQARRTGTVVTLAPADDALPVR